jgi:gas vesicle protein
MISWISSGVIKNLLLVGVVIGAAASIYSMYRSVVGLEVENEKLKLEVEVATDSVEAIGRQASMQANRATKLNSKLRRVKQTLAIAETRILDRNLAEVVKNDPEAAAQTIQEEINSLFREIETIANAADLSSVDASTP